MSGRGRSTIGNMPAASPMEVPRLARAFPAEIRPEVAEAILGLPESELEPTVRSIGSSGARTVPVRVDGEAVDVPYRIYNPANLPRRSLSPIQAAALACLYTRHHDGFVRQRSLRQAIDSEESFVVESGAHAPETVDVPLDLEGLTPSLTDDGALELTNADGDVVGGADTPLMWGSATDPVTGGPTVIAPVPSELVQTLDGYTLELTPDPSFWSDPDLTFPVTIDPSANLSLTTDTYVRSDLPTNSYNNATVLRAGHDTTSTARSMFQFDATGLAYQQIDSATLSLYEVYADSCTATEIDVYGASSTWSGSTNWNTKPTLGTKFASTTAAKGHAGCPAGTVSFSTGGDDGLALTDLVQTWANGDANAGVVVMVDESVNSWKRFNASEAGTGVPTLAVTYEPADVNELLSDPTLGQSQADAIAAWGAANSQTVDPNAFSDCPDVDQYNRPTDQNVPYKQIDATHWLRLDVYAPTPVDEDTTYAALVLVHGGGWWRGCKTEQQMAAAVLAGTWNLNGNTFPLPEKFIVFNINYRLACGGSDSYLDFTTTGNEEVDDKPVLCGNYFTTTDFEGSGHDDVPTGPAVHDVQDAMKFAREHAADYCPEGVACWNQHVELVGASAGGNLAFEASGRVGTLSEDHDWQADAIGAWSGPMKLTQLTDVNWPCTLAETQKPMNCITATTKYIHCGGSTYPPGSACVDNYTSASPDTTFLVDTDLPMAFFANGTPWCINLGCYPLPASKLYEVISLNSATDYVTDLLSNGWHASSSGTNGFFKFCQVDVDLHAAYIFQYACDTDDPDVSVLESMVTYLMPAVT